MLPADIKITIERVEKEYELLTNDAGILPTPDQLINIKGQWYREVEPVKQDEILSFKSETGIWNLNEDKVWYNRQTLSIRYQLSEMLNYVKEGKATIESVKRLTDGEVFSVGKNENRIGDITKIEIIKNEIFLYSGNTNCVRLDYAKKVKQPTILLTTEDGKEITDGEQVLYGIDIVFNGFYKSTAKNCNNKDVKYFSTKEAREEYILQNKPITVSYKNFLKSLYEKGAWGGFEIDTIKQLFKQLQTK